MSHATGAETARQSQELHIFHDVAKALTSSLDLDSILQTIMEKMAEYFQPDTWSLLMVDEQKNELYFAIAVGTAAEALKNVRLKVGEGIAGHVAKYGEKLVVPDVRADQRFAKRIDQVTQMGDAVNYLHPVARQTAGAGRDSVGECGHGALRPRRAILSAGAL